jgi:hypothetical protein
MNYYEWKWRKGEPYDKSLRQHNSQISNLENIEYIKNVEKSAYSTSLNQDETPWDILNNNFSLINKREITEQKQTERQNICQTNMNPYMCNNNYLEDVSNRDIFLKPISTNMEKEH